MKMMYVRGIDLWKNMKIRIIRNDESKGWGWIEVERWIKMEE